MVLMIAAHAEHIEVEPLEELGDRQLGVHKIIHKTQFVAVSCRMTQRGLVHTALIRKCAHIAALDNQVYGLAGGLLVVVRQLEWEQEFAVDVGEQGKADHGE